MDSITAVCDPTSDIEAVYFAMLRPMQIVLLLQHRQFILVVFGWEAVLVVIFTVEMQQTGS